MNNFVTKATRITNSFTKTDLWNEDRMISSKMGINVFPYKGQLKVYLAGKIEPFDWRSKILNTRGDSGYMGNDLSPMMRKFFFTHYGQSISKDLLITGPFFISCDHGCFHGENTHGVGVNKETCDGRGLYGLQERDVVDICLTQISNSDIIFSYIDDITCYGTIAELGYARKKNKKIFIIFSSTEIADELWFVKNMADQYLILDGNDVVEKGVDLENDENGWTHEVLKYFPINRIKLNIDFQPIKPLINKYLPEKYIIR